MRPETHQLETAGIRLAIDQEKVGLGVTIPVIFPLAGERVIEIPPGQELTAASKSTAAIKSASRVLLWRPDCSRQ
jgi:hypothetical protein